MRDQTQKSLDLLRKMLSDPQYGQAMRKSWLQPATATTGFTRYNLELGAKRLYPVNTPLRNMLSRQKVTGGNAINWRALTGINTSKSSPGVSEGNRNEFLSHTTQDFTRKFAGLGHEDYVTFEAGYSGEGFDDIRGLSMETALQSLMISEELMILGGNATLALGTPATPTDNGTSASGGSIGAATYNVKVVALTLEGLRMAGSTGPVVNTTSRTNADGSVDTINGGSSALSAAFSTGALGGSTNTIKTKVTAIRGAVAYAWYVGTAGAEKLEAITTVNQVTLTALAGTGQAATAITADHSLNTLVFDGIITQISDSTTNGYWKSLDNATLTGNSDGSIVEIDAALKNLWDNYQLTVQDLWVSSQELLNLTNKVTAGGTATAFRITIPQGAAAQGTITAGSVVGQYISKFSMEGGQVLPIRLHPNLPAGTLMGLSYRLPYANNRVPEVWNMAVRQEYYGQDWPLTKRRYEYGTYVDEVLRGYAGFSNFVISNIKNG